MPLSSMHHTLSLLFRWVAFHHSFQRRDAISRAFSLSVGCACVLLSNTMARPERLDLSTSFLFLTFHRERLKPNTVINYSIDAVLIGGTGLTKMQQQVHSGPVLQPATCCFILVSTHVAAKPCRARFLPLITTLSQTTAHPPCSPLIYASTNLRSLLSKEIDVMLS